MCQLCQLCAQQHTAAAVVCLFAVLRSLSTPAGFCEAWAKPGQVFVSWLCLAGLSCLRNANHVRSSVADGWCIVQVISALLTPLHSSRGEAHFLLLPVGCRVLTLNPNVHEQLQFCCKEWLPKTFLMASWATSYLGCTQCGRLRML